MICDQCEEEIDGTPAAFDLNQWEYPEGLRFCNFHCLEAYAVDNSDDEECEDATPPIGGAK